MTYSHLSNRTMLSFIISTFVLQLVVCCHAHEGHHHDHMDEESPVEKSSAILFHVFSLTLTAFVAMPIGYCFIIQKQYFYHKLVQLLSVSIMFIVGLYAKFSWSSGTSYHSYLGKLILFLIIIQSVLPLLKYCTGKEYALSNVATLRNIHYYTAMLLLVFIFPLQFFLGIAHITSPQHHTDDAFLGHSVPGFAFVYFGMFNIWNYNNPQRIMNYETIGLLAAPTIELFGAIVFAIPDHFHTFNWPHVLLHCQMLFIGIFCAIYWCTNVQNRKLYHALSVAFSVSVFGYSALHDSGDVDNGTSQLHVMSGQLCLFAAVFRGFSKHWLSGICIVFAGVAFTCSNENIVEYWEQRLMYDTTLYVVIVLCFAFHVAATNVLLHHVYERIHDPRIKGNKKDLEKVERTAGDASSTRETVPFLMDVE